MHQECKIPHVDKNFDSSLLASFFLTPTLLRAILDVCPLFSPLFAPLKRASTALTGARCESVLSFCYWWHVSKLTLRRLMAGHISTKSSIVNAPSANNGHEARAVEFIRGQQSCRERRCFRQCAALRKRDGIRQQLSTDAPSWHRHAPKESARAPLCWRLF